MENENPENSPAPEQDLPDELQPDVPESPPVEYFKCRRGHVTEGFYVRVARKMNPDGTATVVGDTGPLCTLCEIEFCRAKFGTSPYQPPHLQGQ